ncbi:unnamed protein product [Cylicocyclus nassatus]|uniref:7TM GPCR serpentine receptor class x (Srx) domain-containing protein n=1 Tax=Cylicocyclus nassatus TaxID=53992 RepID=A0AA36H6E8_CYLNA|nr:unnamed protein product [Cylicocyclus nassatus]
MICAEFISKYVDFYVIVSFLIAGTALDLLTAIGIYHYFRENSRVDRHFSHTDVLFFIQSCTTNLLLIVCLLIVANLIPVYQAIFGERQEHFAKFVMTTLLMETSHALDGLIMVIFNPKTRAQLLRPQGIFKRAKKNPVVCTITVTSAEEALPVANQSWRNLRRLVVTSALLSNKSKADYSQEVPEVGNDGCSERVWTTAVRGVQRDLPIVLRK